MEVVEVVFLVVVVVRAPLDQMQTQLQAQVETG
jgi:hypothetical protein